MILKNEPTPGKGTNSKLMWFLLGGILLIFLVGGYVEPFFRGEKEIPYSTLRSYIEKGEVKKVVVKGGYVVATPTEEALKKARAAADKREMEFSEWRSYSIQPDETLVPLLDKYHVEYSAEPAEGCGESGSSLLILLLPLFLMYFFFSTMRRITVGSDNPATTFGQSKAKLNVEEGVGVRFVDVAGCDEAKHELEEIVDFLREPTKYTRLGGQVPKGVLLVGPPGTGKTLLARAVAGEANVPFFNLSGSDFVEMFVGVGAARVRDLFEKAKEKSPCIIFIDEIDAIGKSRQGKGFQSNEEREQTLNALLVEMDGFQDKNGIILLAATNRPEVLDPALLRPGRFDRQVVVDRPDVKGRLEILKVHVRKIVTGEYINEELQKIARQTPGFNGADLANVVNEAALLAARHGKKEVEMVDFQEAIERVIAGLEKKNRRLNEKEFNIVAYHESGHAIVTAALDCTDQVHKVSIVSRGIAALGYTLQVPHEDRYLMTKAELFNKICGLLGGRAAEEIVFGDISTGASNDLERVTNIARRIVINYGMSHRLGHVNYTEEGSMLGPGFNSRDYSEETAQIIDHEVHGLIDHLYQETLRILRENYALLDEMAQYLKREEVLEGEALEDMLHRVVRSGNVRPFGTDGTLDKAA